VVSCYLALYVVNLVWALFVLDPSDPSVMGGYPQTSVGHGDLFVLAWFVASAATVGGGLGSGLESDEAIRAAAYSKREEQRRNRLARQRSLEQGSVHRRCADWRGDGFHDNEGGVLER